MTMAAPGTNGIYTLSVRYYGVTADLARVDLIISTPGGAAAAVLTTPTIVGGTGTITVKAYNLPGSTPVDLYISGLGIVASGMTLGSGAIELTSGTVTLPVGSYNVRLVCDGVIIVPSPSMVTVGVTFSLASSSGPIRSGDTATAYGLEPSTSYDLLFGTTDLGTYTTSASVGSLIAVPFTVPDVITGTYTVELVPTGAPTTVVASATYTVVLPTGLTMTGTSFIPLQQVNIAVPVDDFLLPVDAPEVPPCASSYLTLDGYTIGNGFCALTTDSTGNYVTTSFMMPNGAPGTLILGVYITDFGGDTYGPVYVVIQRISGAGSIVVGTSLSSDIAYIKSGINNITVSLSALDASVASINGTAVTLSTRVGTMSTTLNAINANVVSIQGSVATLTSNVGTIVTDVANLPTGLTAISTALTAAQAAETAATAAEAAAQTTQSSTSTITTLVYVAIVLALIAALASIVAVITLQRKVA
jgi:hypothetical protein